MPLYDFRERTFLGARSNLTTGFRHIDGGWIWPCPQEVYATIGSNQVSKIWSPCIGMAIYYEETQIFTVHSAQPKKEWEVIFHTCSNWDQTHQIHKVEVVFGKQIVSVWYYGNCRLWYHNMLSKPTGKPRKNIHSQFTIHNFHNFRIQTFPFTWP